MATNVTKLGTPAPASRPTWTTWRQALQVATYPGHLRKSITIMLLIGSVFVGVNQVPMFLSGHADGIVFAKAIMTYLTPFCVSTYSILVATRASGRNEI